MTNIHSQPHLERMSMNMNRHPARAATAAAAAARALLVLAAFAPSAASDRLNSVSASDPDPPRPASSSSSSPYGDDRSARYPAHRRRDPSLLEETYDDLPNQSLPAPYMGQHVGVALADLNGDGAVDLLFAAGRHWVDQSYALINLGPASDERADGFGGVKFSDALPIGPPGGYYQIDVLPRRPPSGDGGGSGSGPSAGGAGDDDSNAHHATVLLVGGTCHVDDPNSLGSCRRGENTPARVLRVSMRGDGCSVRRPDAPCDLAYELAWEHPDPRGDRNGGFAKFGGSDVVALLGQGGIELFEPAPRDSAVGDALRSGKQTARALSRLHEGYSPVYRHSPREKTDPRSDYARYAGFAAGTLPSLGGVVAAGRRSDYDTPRTDGDGNVVGINKLVYEKGGDVEGRFGSSPLPANVSGEPYPGNRDYSVQSTNYAFADIDGDGIEDLLEATFLYRQQRVPEYPLPQRVHFLDEGGGVKDTLVVVEDGVRTDRDGEEDEDAGRSVTTGQIFDESEHPDVVFASAEGVVTLFANLGVDEDTGAFRGLEKRHQLSVGTDRCQVRDVEVARLTTIGDQGKCQIGIVCAVTCGIDVPGRNHVFYVEGSGTACRDEREKLKESGSRLSALG